MEKVEELEPELVLKDNKEEPVEMKTKKMPLIMMICRNPIIMFIL
jgi:hypothetical protein